MSIVLRGVETTNANLMVVLKEESAYHQGHLA